jgi:Family of unknown function (DUF6220)
LNSARVLFFGLTAIYLLAVLVQFFLAGLAVFGSTADWDAHAGLGFVLSISTLLLLVLAVVGRLPRRLILVTLLLVGLNALQLVLPHIEVAELAALHPVNAVAIVFVAYALMQGSRVYVTSKMAA